jgi:hypothetical protein
MLIVPDGVGITNCRAAAGANNKAENWQQNVDEQVIACVDYEQNETLNQKKSRMNHAQYHEPRTGVSRHSYVKRWPDSTTATQHYRLFEKVQI